jgi:hypothetical protein
MNSPEFRGEIIDFEIKPKRWADSAFPDWDRLTLIYADGRRIELWGDDHGHEDPWISAEQVGKDSANR